MPRQWFLIRIDGMRVSHEYVLIYLTPPLMFILALAFFSDPPLRSSYANPTVQAVRSKEVVREERSDDRILLITITKNFMLVASLLAISHTGGA